MMGWPRLPGSYCILALMKAQTAVVGGVKRCVLYVCMYSIYLATVHWNFAQDVYFNRQIFMFIRLFILYQTPLSCSTVAVNHLALHLSCSCIGRVRLHMQF